MIVFFIITTTMYSFQALFLSYYNAEIEIIRFSITYSGITLSLIDNFTTNDGHLYQVI